MSTDPSRETIYTIPVNDAFSRPEPCPLCRLAEHCEVELLDYYLGPSLMEPDVRQQTNVHGFCQAHLRAMYLSQKNRLGLGLMLRTYLEEGRDKWRADLRQTAAAQAEKRRLFAGQNGDRGKEALRQAAETLRQETDDCVVCQRSAYTMDRYMDVFCWLFGHDPVFRQKFNQTQAFCRPHLALLLDSAAKYMDRQTAGELAAALADKQARYWERLSQDVEWFTLKFDYRNTDKPWGAAKDALPRAIDQLEGRTEGGLTPDEQA